jgi:Spy/CpxP family protein refolding chaperone
MRRATRLILSCALTLAASTAFAQPPDGPRGPNRDAGDASDPVSRIMKFDKNGDGKLTKDEVTDARFNRLFAAADANKDGVVTKEELTTLVSQAPQGDRGGPGGFGGPGGPGGFGGPGGPGGPGGRFMGAPPRPGEILPGMLRQRLQLTAQQRTQVDALQKEVDGKLAKILNADQKEQLAEMRQRGPGGPPPGGPPDGGPDGPPPGGRRPPPPDNQP